MTKYFCFKITSKLLLFLEKRKKKHENRAYPIDYRYYVFVSELKNKYLGKAFIDI